MSFLRSKVIERKYLEAQHKKYIERSKNFVSCSNDFTLEKLEHEFNIVP